MKFKYLKVDDIRSLIIFILCVGILVFIPVYWFVFVPPAPQLQEIHQNSNNISGYFAPGGYINLEMDLGKDSIAGLHNGELNIIPHIINSQNESLWKPTDMRVDQWPGSKSQIKYSSGDHVNQRMILILDNFDIPNSTELKGKTVPITVKYTVNHPALGSSTELLGGTVDNFDVNTDIIEKNISITLNNQVLTQKDRDAVSMNEGWKKVTSAVVWIIVLLIIILMFLKIGVVENFEKKTATIFNKVVEWVKNTVKSIEDMIYR